MSNDTTQTREHTPGPWKAEKFRENHPIEVFAWLTSYPRVVARAYEWDGKDARANARLIAAAPELLEAADALRAHMECYCPTADEVTLKGPCAVCKADAAIAKARGETYA